MLWVALAVPASTPCASWAHPHGPNELVTHEHTALGLEIEINDEEVVLDVLMSNGFLNTMIPKERGHLRLTLEGDRFRFLDPKQEAIEREVCSEFFLNVNRVTVNGAEIQPVFESMEFLRALDPTGRVDHSNLPPDARVVLRYPTATRPQQVSVMWEVFPKIIQRDMFGDVLPFELAAKLDAYQESKIVTFTAEEPEVAWQAPLIPAADRIQPIAVAIARDTIGIPVASLATIGAWAAGLLWLRRSNSGAVRRRRAVAITLVAIAAALGAQHVLVAHVPAPWAPQAQLPDELTAAATVSRLLRNVYRAFDFKSESDVYDVLARSVAGPELENIYNEVFQSLIVREQGGAVARVKDVNILETDIDFAGAMPTSDEIAFRARCRWQVHGVVYHWGHVHERTNEYEALYTVAQHEGFWKIVATTPLGHLRVDPAARETASDPGNTTNGKSP
jgi:hypothetical protein